MRRINRYYTAVAASLCAVLGILCVLIRENDRFERQQKRRFYATYLVIAAAILTEWGAIALNGAGRLFTLHRVIKAADYIVSSLASVMFVYQLKTKRSSNRLRVPVIAVLAGNALLQTVSVFTGWTFYLDARNYYRHGPLYPVYMAVYIGAFAYVLAGFLRYGRGFRNRNRASLILIFIFAAAELLLQEIFGGDMRTLCVGLTMASVLLYVHFSEFSQLERDDILIMQRKLLDTDVLTGLYSRYAYTAALNAMKNDAIPEDTVVFSADITGLKEANDTLGHLAGDELIRGAADCILRALGPYGRCYRTGGDEFIAILHMPEETAEEALKQLRAEAGAWHGEIVPDLKLAAGVAYAPENAGGSAEALINLADQRMYADKAEYYRTSGIERRRTTGSF